MKLELTNKQYKNKKEVLNKVNNLTYNQNWSIYNTVKTKEKTLSIALLIELLDCLKDKDFKFGRSHFNLKEKILCMFIYAYSRFSSRRCICDIEMLKKAGLIPKTPHFNSVLNMFRDSSISKILYDLIEITSMPLRMFEDHLSIDASGFSTSQFIRWRDVRNDKYSKLRTWRKIHLICGARTHIIGGVSITGGYESDCKFLEPLVKIVNKNKFEAKEISADKAYLSRKNLETISSVGAIPYIPFKKNSIGNPKGCKLWSALFKYYHNNHDKFMSRYHLRSNVESTFSMIKRNFGNKLRTLNSRSQLNEILMKCLCHNLSVLVLESFELGFKVDFNACADEYFENRYN